MPPPLGPLSVCSGCLSVLCQWGSTCPQGPLRDAGAVAPAQKRKPSLATLSSHWQHGCHPLFSPSPRLPSLTETLRPGSQALPFVAHGCLECLWDLSFLVCRTGSVEPPGGAGASVLGEEWGTTMACARMSGRPPPPCEQHDQAGSDGQGRPRAWEQARGRSDAPEIGAALCNGRWG